MDNRKTRKKVKRKNATGLIVIIFAIFVLVAGGIIAVNKYAPTTEHMDLSEFYETKSEDEVLIIYNGQFDPENIQESPQAIEVNNTPYIEISYIKNNLDNGYVYDREEKILRYVTDKDVISVQLGDLFYTQGRDTIGFQEEIIIEKEDRTYLNPNFLKIFTDYNYTYYETPNRVCIESIGITKNIGTLSKDSAIRRFGGPKSKILKDSIKGEKVWILDDYGKWSKVITEDGVIGCIKTNVIKDRTNEINEPNLPPREYSHNLMPEKIKMGWHQVGSADGNSSLNRMLSNTFGLNVISPTWYRISDNLGNITSFATQEYVNTCHNAGIKVWGLVSNFDTQGIDSTAVLNKTSSRDNLVNSLVGRAISDNIDGINVDFEALSADAADGYIEFIKELSIKCKANGLVLSVDNYKPESFNMFYNRREQAKYADYLIVMAYDEHHGDSTEAGSNSSLPFVKEAISGTLSEDVPKEQLVLALPFYTRVFSTVDGNVVNKPMGMQSAAELEQKYNAQKVWLPDQEQYYLKYQDEGITYEVWLEDEESLSRKISLVKENDLGGVSFWKLGFEPASIWEIVASYVN